MVVKWAFDRISISGRECASKVVEKYSVFAEKVFREGGIGEKGN